MQNHKLKTTLLAFAIAQAFPSAALGQQTMSEVVVSGDRVATGDRARIGGFSDRAVLQTPASISAFGRDEMDDLGIRMVSDAMRFDTSVGDSYNAVGYAEQFSIRGFAVNNATGYRKDGLAIPGDAQIPLENKDRIEILRGLSGLQAGVSAPGGIVNFVLKRPTQENLRSATIEVRERGTAYAAVDFGGRFADKRFGYRINAAGEKLRSYVRGADGERAFVSGAFDWQVNPQALLQVDFDHQHKSQISAPGYQLINGETLPDVSPEVLLNKQPWSKPVVTDSTNFGIRLDVQLGDGWRATVSANKHWFKRDDFAAFPYGCSAADLYPGYCANGDYDVYDYQSTGERKRPSGMQAMVQGKEKIGGMVHEVTVGASRFGRHDFFGDYVYDYAGTSNIYKNVTVDPAPGNPSTGPVSERNNEDERALFVQDIINLSDKLELHAGLRYVDIQRNGGDDQFTLPNVALVFKPVRNWMVYGSIAHGMENGGVAPMGTENENQVLAPSRSRQAEIGAKGMFGNALTLSATLFQVTKGLEYTDAMNFYIRNGEQRHRGLELSVHGKAGQHTTYGMSMTAMETNQSGTNNKAVDNKRVTNVPELKFISWGEYTVPSLPALKLNGYWQYAGNKAFDVSNRFIVPGYHLLGAGASYTVQGVKIRAMVDNLADKRHWRDVTPELGGYLLPGAPRTFKLSAQFDF
jgi:iron complex outermembrane receptor protein